MASDLTDLLTPPVITGLVAVLLLVPPAGIAQRMVELHGGRLDITTEGGDTVVACKLPTGGASGRQVGRPEPVAAGS